MFNIVPYCLPGGDLQTSTNALEDGALDDALDWEEEKEMERLACEGDDFVPPKIMVGLQICLEEDLKKNKFLNTKYWPLLLSFRWPFLMSPTL